MYIQSVYSANVDRQTARTYGQQESGGNDSSMTAQVKDALGKDDFLNLLVTQLRYQDPMSPMDDTQFIAQLAQFSTLEQMGNLADQMDMFMNLQVQTSLLAQMTQLLGQHVEVLDPDTKKTVQGPVEGIEWVDGLPKLVVNGKRYDMTNLERVSAEPPSEGDSEEG